MLAYSLIALLLVWITIFAAWRSYRISALRENLGALHYRLPGGAASDYAHDRLERLLAAASRDAGLMTFTRLLLASWAQQRGYLSPSSDPFPPAEELASIHRAMHWLIARHVICGCPLLWILSPQATLAAFGHHGLEAQPAKVWMLPGMG